MTKQSPAARAWLSVMLETNMPMARNAAPRKKKARIEKMKAIKASGRTYGEYTSGCWYREPKELEGTIPAKGMTEGWNSGWIPVDDRPKGANTAVRLRVNPQKMTVPRLKPTKNMAYKEKPDIPFEDIPARTKQRYKIPKPVVEAGTAYSETEDGIILKLHDKGETYTTIGMKLGRTPASIKSRYRKLSAKMA